MDAATDQQPSPGTVTQGQPIHRDATPLEELP
jgi:hypothetical protein